MRRVAAAVCVALLELPYVDAVYLVTNRSSSTLKMLDLIAIRDTEAEWLKHRLLQIKWQDSDES